METAPKWTWLVLVMVMVTLIAVGIWLMASTSIGAKPARMAATKPLCADQQVYRPDFEIAPEMKIKISPDCWSGWVTIPNQAKFRISSPDNLEILTWQGDWLFIEPDSAEWLGEVRFSNFRLSGGGRAVVFVERR